ncbi:hypothetical protein SUGI_0245530 [Cryptomeria japonica]|nr:hypothetical protein SUGI_0245530 [Cryptomeria japonica]
MKMKTPVVPAILAQAFSNCLASAIANGASVGVGSSGGDLAPLTTPAAPAVPTRRSALRLFICSQNRTQKGLIFRHSFGDMENFRAETLKGLRWHSAPERVTGCLSL